MDSPHLVAGTIACGDVGTEGGVLKKKRKTHAACEEYAPLLQTRKQKVKRREGKEYAPFWSGRAAPSLRRDAPTSSIAFQAANSGLAW